MNNQQPFKKRVEIVFSENDKDLWEWLEETKQRKATFIKKVLRDTMNNVLLNNEEIEQKIKEEIKKVISNTAVTPEIDNSNVYKSSKPKQKKATGLFKAREF